MNPSFPIKVVIADDHELLRTGYRKILQEEYASEIEFVAEAKDGHQLLEAVAALQPEVVITDIQMPVMNGIMATNIIKKKYPKTEVIAFSMFSDTTSIMGMLQSGASGYLVKTSSKEEIIEAIKSVQRGTPYYCSSISEKMYGTIANSHLKKKKNESICFSEQEKKVMRLICRQQSIKEIADSMGLSTRTVEHYRQNILEKIGARNVVGIALFAVVHEIVKLSEFL